MKIGDRVKIVRECAKQVSQRHDLMGFYGKIAEINDNMEFPIFVRLDGEENEYGFLRTELEVIE